MSTPELTVDFLDPESYRDAIPEIEVLFQTSFERDLGEGYLRWRYLDNPAGGLLACVARDGDQIVANYSASPCVMTVGADDVRTALSMTTMTHPGYQGRGLFTTLAQALYGYMADTGHSMVWGFPNALSHRPIVQRLRWFDIYEVPTMTLDVAAVRERAMREGPEVRHDDGFELDYAPNPSLGGMLHVRKSGDYLRWRYAANPLNSYRCLVLQDETRVRSYAVVKEYGDALDLVDFQVRDADNGAVLLSSVVRLARDGGRDRVLTWAPRHHLMHGLCERLGFVNGLPITYFGARAFDADAAETLGVHHFDRWFIQMGDSDVY